VTLPVIYRDAHLLAVDKPAGLAVHRGWATERDVAIARVRALLGPAASPSLVHRLDRGTSGVLLFGLSREATARLGEAFAGRDVHKLYLALVRGVPPAEGVIDHPLPRDEDTPAGQPPAPRLPAVTAFTRREVMGRYSLVEARPLTGRLHQVRRHLKHFSCPIIGDVNHGKGDHNRAFREALGLHRMFLHAAELRLPHPVTGAPLTITAPLPAELERALAALREDPTLGGRAPTRARQSTGGSD
jgi:tRNA pseudouridine65 synthase